MTTVEGVQALRPAIAALSALLAACGPSCDEVAFQEAVRSHQEALLVRAEVERRAQARADSLVYGGIAGRLPARLYMETPDGDWLALDWHGDSLTYEGTIPPSAGAQIFLYWVQETARRQVRPTVFPSSPQADALERQ